MIHLSEHFRTGEFLCRHCGEPCPEGISRRLVEKLEELRALVGGPLHINSGYRCAEYNEYLQQFGAARHSLHMTGQAADVTARTCGPVKVARLAEKCGFGGIGRYAGFTHVDVGPDRHWRGTR